MVVDDKLEEPLRKMLGHAIRNELDDVAAVAVSMGDEAYTAGMELCVMVTGYIAVDVCGRWPTEADLREMARLCAQSATDLPVTEEDMHTFLSRVVFGTEQMETVFTDQEKVVKLPLFTAANALLSFFPKGSHWWAYLDQIWDGVEKASETRDTVLPALEYRVRSQKARATSKAAKSLPLGIVRVRGEPKLLRSPALLVVPTTLLDP